jgi:hypothetical protein
MKHLDWDFDKNRENTREISLKELQLMKLTHPKNIRIGLENWIFSMYLCCY